MCALRGRANFDEIETNVARQLDAAKGERPKEGSHE